MLQNEIEKLLRNYRIPYSEEDLIAANKLIISLHGGHLLIKISPDFPCQSNHSLIKQQITALLNAQFPELSLEIEFDTVIQSHVNKPGIAALSEIKNVIAVGSGKGGVGKSTIASNIAVALAKEGAQVGLLDADIYGPSQPTILGALQEKAIVKDKKIYPIQRHGLASMSIGYLVDANAAMVWRGPMLGKAIEQFIHDTAWPQLDYLIIDLPPGTGDIQLSLCQKIPINGAIIVTTPQEIALSDVRRACEMFLKMDIPLLGIIENMASHTCSHCGHQESIFGEHGGEKLAADYAIPLLAKIPLHFKIRTDTDCGQPTALNLQDDLAKEFYQAAKMAAAKISLQKINYTGKFPKIVIKYDKHRGKSA